MVTDVPKYSDSLIISLIYPLTMAALVKTWEDISLTESKYASLYALAIRCVFICKACSVFVYQKEIIYHDQG